MTWTHCSNVVVTSLAVSPRTYFAINRAGSVIQQPTEFTPADHRDIIHVGTAGHANNTNIVAVRSNPHAAFDVNVRLGDLAEAIGAFNILGNVYEPNGVNVNLDKTVGESYRLGNNFHTTKKQPDITNDAAETVLPIIYSYMDGGSGYTLLTSTTSVDTNNYDDGTGTLAAMPINDWQVQIIKHFPGGAGTRIEYGQTTYGTSAAAVAAIPDVNHIHNPAFAEGVIRGYLVIQQGEVAALTGAIFVEAGRFGAAGAACSSGSSVFSSAFESSPLAITISSDHSAVHGLGVRPAGMQAFIRCNTAEFGYVSGDEAEFMNGGATNYKGLSADVTSIYWYTGTSLVVTNRTTGAIQAITVANWDIILRAYA